MTAMVGKRQHQINMPRPVAYVAAVIRLEDAILQNVAERIHDRMTSEQRTAFAKELSEKLKDFDASEVRKAVGAGGLLALGGMGGFATYTTMSSLLHFVSGGLLGFGAYTAASSVLSIVLGPIGWATFAGYALFKAGSPKLKLLLPIAISVSLIRKQHSQE